MLAFIKKAAAVAVQTEAERKIRCADPGLRTPRPRVNEAGRLGRVLRTRLSPCFSSSRLARPCGHLEKFKVPVRAKDGSPFSVT